MKRRFIFTLGLIFILYTVNAEQDSIKNLRNEINILKSNTKELSKNNSELNKKILNLTTDVARIEQQVHSNTLNIQQTSDSLGRKIKSTDLESKTKYNELGVTLSKNTLYGIIAIILVLCISVLIYFFLSNRQKSDKTEVIDQIAKTKNDLEEEQIKVYTKITEIHQSQLDLIKQERVEIQKGIEPDHSLVKKIAEEMVKMQMNLVNMDNKVKGHRQLSIAVNNVYENLKANGYEIIDYLNKTYHEGMNMEATMEPDPSLKEGEFIIKRIIKPEVHFNNKVIQYASVIVAFGE